MIGGKVGKQRADPNRERYAESEFTGFQQRAFLGIVRVIENLNQVPLPIHAFELMLENTPGVSIGDEDPR